MSKDQQQLVQLKKEKTKTEKVIHQLQDVLSGLKDQINSLSIHNNKFSFSKLVKCKTGSDESKEFNNYQECVLVSQEYRKIHTGPKGGKYYFNPSGSKKYVSGRETFLVPEEFIATWSKGLIEEKQAKIYVDCVEISGEYRRVHTGPKRGKFYFTKSGRKEYRIQDKTIYNIELNQVVDWKK